MFHDGYLLGKWSILEIHTEHKGHSALISEDFFIY